MNLRRPFVLAAITLASILGFGLSIAGDPFQVVIRQAEYHLSRHEYGQAIELYRGYLDVKPGQPEISQRLADLCLLKNKPDAAKSVLNSWATANPGDPWPHLSLGSILASQGQPVEAEAEYRKALNLDPGLRNARRGLAELLLDQGSIDLAHSELDTLLRQDDSDQASHFKLGQILVAQSSPLAIAHLQRAIDLKADPIVTAQAEDILETLLTGQAEGNGAHAAASLGRALLKIRAITLANHQFAEATKLDSDYADAFAYLGYTWLLLGRADLAQVPLEKAVLLDPTSPFGHNILGDTLRARGMVQAAVEEMKKAVEIDSTDPFLLSDLALTYLAANDISAAEETYVKVVDLARSDPAFVGQLAHFYLDRLFKLEKGLAAARRLVDLDSGNGESVDLLGWALYLNGQTGEAGKALNQSLKLTPYLASAHYHLAVLQEQSGQIDKAKQGYERAADLDLSGAIEKRAKQALSQIAADAATVR